MERRENDIRDYDAERNLVAWRYQRAERMKRIDRTIIRVGVIAVLTALMAAAWRYL